jgi:hypothetical protein
MKGNLDTLKKVWDYAEENLTAEKINKKLLLGTHLKGESS